MLFYGWQMLLLPKNYIFFWGKKWIKTLPTMKCFFEKNIFCRKNITFWGCPVSISFIISQNCHKMLRAVKWAVKWAESVWGLKDRVCVSGGQRPWWRVHLFKVCSDLDRPLPRGHFWTFHIQDGTVQSFLNASGSWTDPGGRVEGRAGDMLPERVDLGKTISTVQIIQINNPHVDEGFPKLVH